mmetsp:Transcript_7428/g.13638  ORF Transcript_7428/g.13638 Transcript_7428/m.13638 type:complete len:108 (+) Transcript_7428:86-409(+)
MTSTWQDYINSQLVATKDVEQAMMIGKADGAVWASTPDFLPRMYEGVVTQEDGSEAKQVINEAVSAAFLAGLCVVARGRHGGKLVTYSARSNGGRVLLKRQALLQAG